MVTSELKSKRTTEGRRDGVSCYADGPRHVTSVMLFRRYQRAGDRAAREALVSRFLPLAHSLARRYAQSREPQEDLMQVASLALLKAIDRFDPARGTSFVTFATPTILGELKRYFRDLSWPIHVARDAQERAQAIDRAATSLSNELGRAPTVEEISTHLRLSSEEVLDGLQAMQAYTLLSLDAPRGSDPDEDNDLTIQDVLGAEDDRFELIEEDATVGPALRMLPERERRILHLRFVEDLTQSEIAAQVGVSQMQVSRLLRRSIAQLRAHTGADASVTGPDDGRVSPSVAMAEAEPRGHEVPAAVSALAQGAVASAQAC
jgi:RNA polymerase sigma-B factor